MHRRVLALFIAAAAALAVLAPAHAADPVFPTGSRIGIVPPKGFAPSTKFPGFEDAERKAAVTLIELPEPAYQALEKSAFAGGSKTLTVEKRELFTFAGGIGFLVTGHDDVNGAHLRSWYLLANTTNLEIGHVAALVGVRVPEEARAAYPDETIRAALKTVSFRKAPTAELLKLLPFQAKDLAGFRVLRVAPPGILVLIDGPSDDLTRNPYMIVSLGRGAPEAADSRPRFARDLLTAAPLPDLAVTSGEAMRINGGQGYEVRAKAKGADGAPIAVVQWLRFGSGNGFLRVIGIVGTDKWDDMFTRFRAVRDGIDLR